MGLAGIADDFGKSAGKKVLVDRLKALMTKHHVSPELQRMAVFAVDNSVEYIDLCVKMRRKPDDPKVLTDFLISKGVFTAKMAHQDMACAVSLVEFANNLRKNIPKARGFAPAALVAALTALDVLAVGNSCQFMQEAYYHAFLATSTTHLRSPPMRSELKLPADPLAFLSAIPSKDRNLCEATKHQNRMAVQQAIPLFMP